MEYPSNKLVKCWGCQYKSDAWAKVLPMKIKLDMDKIKDLQNKVFLMVMSVQNGLKAYARYSTKTAY